MGYPQAVRRSYTSRGVVLACAALTGCAGWFPTYLELSGGAVAGASEAHGFGAGPIVGLSAGIYLEPVKTDGPVDIGLGLDGHVAFQDFDRADRPVMIVGFDADLALPIYELAPPVHLRWHAMLTLGAGGVAAPPVMGADPELEPDFATAVFTGVGFSFQLGGRWQDRPNLFSVAIGPYGLFIGGPAAYGGGLLKLRLYLNL